VATGLGDIPIVCGEEMLDGLEGDDFFEEFESAISIGVVGEVGEWRIAAWRCYSSKLE
jgi:hypothetical protein